ncbi:hypothetical protein pkur_cds_486 [Pandoravirus kuranda]|uniref:Uncharacterized protein n=2 Tax=Pandoravirus TaxID=2060084 RepID=A0AA95ED88_9VIRU|nr:hypothetical protein pneo_cds_521 [Pandoravirus neocaledonia]AVK76128.1 hypothetical protein pneo_cds_521 [Pandoravirus neocaledonia]WBR14660.1 hypothetical protein pkur_cds_486 [Pandoravirus kuranda]
MLLRASHHKAPDVRPAPSRRVSAVAAPPVPSQSPSARFGPDGTVRIDDSIMARYASFVDQATATTSHRTVHASPQPLAVPSPPQHRTANTVVAVGAPLARPAPFGTTTNATLQLARPVPLAPPAAAMPTPRQPGSRPQVAPPHNHADRGATARAPYTPSPSLPRAPPSLSPTVGIVLQCVVALIMARIINAWLRVCP